MINNEFFITPQWPVLRILEALDIPGNGRWLEPCVGTGAILRSVEHHYRDRVVDRGRSWTTMDIARHGEYRPHIVGDFLKATQLPHFDVAIFHPSFSEAISFVNRAMELADKVIMLQKMNWLASEKRNTWMQEHTPDVYVLPDGISFTGDKSDHQEYGWYVWSKPGYGLEGVGCLQVLPTTLLVQRRKDDAS